MSSDSTEERRRLELPDRRKETYRALAKRIDDHADHIENKLQKWIRRGLIAFSIIALACTLALIGYGASLHSVQGQRHDSCLNQNQRHDRTLALFRSAARDAIKKHPSQAADIRENIAANVSIINALAPKQDCDKVAPQGGFLP